jgi:polysaccharide biosynthesis/export protein
MNQNRLTRLCLMAGLLLIFFSSCVPSKKLVYFQKDDLKKRKEIPKDSVLRVHQLDIQEYKIQPLDMLGINFETLSDEGDAFDFLSKLSPQTRSTPSASGAAVSGLMVDTEGYIEFAVLGKIKLSGLSLFEAKDTLQAAASKFLPDVIVRIRMLNFRYTVLGEVNAEQVVVATNPRLTMSEAIGLAGGFAELADRTHVKIIRQRGTYVEIFYLNLLEEELLESPNYFIQQNDVIIVPPLKQRTFRRYFTSNLSVITSSIAFALFIINLSTR